VEDRIAVLVPGNALQEVLVGRDVAEQRHDGVLVLAPVLGDRVVPPRLAPYLGDDLGRVELLHGQAGLGDDVFLRLAGNRGQDRFGQWSRFVSLGSGEDGFLHTSEAVLVIDFLKIIGFHALLYHRILIIATNINNRKRPREPGQTQLFNNELGCDGGGGIGVKVLSSGVIAKGLVSACGDPI